MSKKRRVFGVEFKAKVALEAIKEQETINQIASRYDVLPVQVSQWKGLTGSALGFWVKGVSGCLGIGLAHKARNALYRHVAHQQQGYRLKGEDEVLRQPFPRSRNRSHLATFSTVASRYRREDFAAVFEDIQVPPKPLLPVVVADTTATSILGRLCLRPHCLRLSHMDLHDPVGLT